VKIADIINRTINQDLLQATQFLPANFVDLLIVDPPYNLNKSFNGNSFKKSSFEDYEDYTRNWLGKIVHTLKPNATVYVCSDWETSLSIYKVLREMFIVRNRITWEREKGRGAKSNWKNCAEDIWFCTKSDNYFFDAEAVKLKRKVIAPYKENGSPKDWNAEENGNFRLTSPSNLWTDISIPFWSMPENTDHPTQKPEKLIAKLILASSKINDVVFDPFLGSGTTSVVAKKLGRNYSGVELNNEYACLAEKRLDSATVDKTIQGYSGGCFWERNTLALQKRING
jgi:site-specific DNA-methyltransferase (adenine-specific)